jgi:hypothetical protein
MLGLRVVALLGAASCERITFKMRNLIGSEFVERGRSLYEMSLLVLKRVPLTKPVEFRPMCWMLTGRRPQLGITVKRWFSWGAQRPNNEFVAESWPSNTEGIKKAGE